MISSILRIAFVCKGGLKRNLKKIFRAKSDFIPRKIADEFILVPVGDMALTLHGMIVLSESGKLLWDKLQKGCSENDLTETILQEYEVDFDTARKDVIEFLGKMSQLNILEEMN